MADGRGMVGRITQLPVHHNKAALDEFNDFARDKVITWEEVLKHRQTLEHGVVVSVAVDDRMDLVNNLLRPTTDSRNTGAKLLKCGWEVIRVRRARSGQTYTERVAAGGSQTGSRKAA